MSSNTDKRALEPPHPASPNLASLAKAPQPSPLRGEGEPNGISESTGSSAGGLPLPEGERDGVRGLAPVAFARELRSRQTDAEKRLWSKLRNRRLAGLKFKRQMPIDRYTVDFCCDEPKIIVEVDGSQHMKAVAYDAERTAVLEAMGYLVLRFWSNDVLTNTDGVVTGILGVLPQTNSLQPSPENGEGNVPSSPHA